MSEARDSHRSDTETGVLGSGLNRPECLLTHASGYVIAADWTDSGGVSVISPGGAVGRVLAKTRLADGPLRPNGICLEPGGSTLAAHLGPELGGVFRLHPDGALEPVLTEIGGQPVPPSNFPLRDRQGRLWLTVSTRVQPRWEDYRRDASTGFVALQDGKGIRIVADHLGKVAGRHLRNITSLAFGGPDLRTAYLGSLHDDRIVTLRSPVAGLEPIHFRYDIGALLSAAGLA